MATTNINHAKKPLFLSFDEFKNSVEKKEKIYKQEMQQLIPVLISFEEVKNSLFSQRFIIK